MVFSLRYAVCNADISAKRKKVEVSGFAYALSGEKIREYCDLQQLHSRIHVHNMVRFQRNGVTVAQDVKAFDCEEHAERFALDKNFKPEDVVKYCTDAKWHSPGDCEAVAAKSAPKSTRNRNCTSNAFLTWRSGLDKLQAARAKGYKKEQRY